MAKAKAAAPTTEKPMGFLDEIFDAVDSVADVVNGDIFNGTPEVTSNDDSPEAPEVPAAPAVPRSPGGTFLPTPKKEPVAPASGDDAKP